jgi:hypothetical protein
MKENAIIKVIINTRNKATTKMLSAIFSYLIIFFSFILLIDKKEKRQLETNKIQANPVISSIIETSLYFEIFNDVKTTRQKPNKFDAVLKICGDLLFSI